MDRRKGLLSPADERFRVRKYQHGSVDEAGLKQAGRETVSPRGFLDSQLVAMAMWMAGLQYWTTRLLVTCETLAR